MTPKRMTPKQQWIADFLRGYSINGIVKKYSQTITQPGDRAIDYAAVENAIRDTLKRFFPRTAL